MSSLFDSIGTPQLRNQIALEKELQQRRDAWSHHTYYSGAGDLLLRHGRFYRGRMLPTQYLGMMGVESQCYINALEAARTHAGLYYCEGIYTTGAGHFTSHAWCVDIDRNLYEVTLPTRDLEDKSHYIGPDGETMPFLPVEHWGYWGVCFAVELVDNIGDIPLLDRPKADAIFDRLGVSTIDERTAWPVLEHPYQPVGP